MVDKKLIKSFILTKNLGTSSKKGDVITIRKYQTQVPLTLDEIYFENNKNGHTFNFGFLFDLKIAEPCEFFQNLEERYNYFENINK